MNFYRHINRYFFMDIIPVPYWTSALSFFICGIPLFSRMKLNFSNYSRDDAPVTLALKSLQFQYACIAGMAVTFPICVEFLLELIEFLVGRKFVAKHKIYVSRDAFLALLIPVIFMFSYIGPNGDAELLLFIFHSQRIFYCHNFLYYMHIHGKHIWKSWATIMVAVSLTLGEIFDCYAAFSNDSKGNTLYIISIVLHLLASIGFILLSVRWFLHNQRKVKKKVALSQSEYVSNVYLVAFLLVIVLLWILNSFYLQATWADVNDMYICWNIYMAIFLSAIISIAHSRETRFALNLTTDALDTRIKFSNYINHAIRNPINIAILGIRLLFDDMVQMGDNQTRIDTVLNIKNSCNTITTVLDDMISYEKFENRISKPDIKLHNAWRFLQEAVKPFLTKGNMDGTYVEFDPPVDIIGNLEHFYLRVDKQAVQHVIRNIISNALKFTPIEGRVVIAVNQIHLHGSMENLHLNDRRSVEGVFSDTKSMLQIEVIDFGPGLSQERQSKVFRQFAQLSVGGETKQDQSSGIGLWLAAGIVEMHAGNIKAHSAGEGKGCTFTIELPMFPVSEVKSNSLDVSMAHSKISSTLGTFTRGRAGFRRANKVVNKDFCKEDDDELENKDDDGKDIYDDIDDDESDDRVGVGMKVAAEEEDEAITVLIVDDSSVDLKMMSNLLKMKNFACVEVMDGLQALQCVKEWHKQGKQAFGLILMDYEMPNMDGPTATKKIRDLGFKGLIIGVTSKILSIDGEHFLAQGADRVIAKPLKMPILDIILSELRRDTFPFDSASAVSVTEAEAVIAPDTGDRISNSIVSGFRSNYANSSTIGKKSKMLFVNDKGDTNNNNVSSVCLINIRDEIDEEDL